MIRIASDGDCYRVKANRDELRVLASVTSYIFSKCGTSGFLSMFPNDPDALRALADRFETHADAESHSDMELSAAEIRLLTDVMRYADMTLDVEFEHDMDTVSQAREALEPALTHRGSNAVSPHPSQDRIESTLQLLAQVWRASPDLRLSQILVNALSPKTPVPEIFYAEDDRLIEGLKRLAELTRRAPNPAPHAMRDNDAP
ncbi:MAG: hypothetical protein Tsb0013_07650 [Phycisphaerales bacterium]